MNYLTAVAADKDNNIIDLPDYGACGMSNSQYLPLERNATTALPYGSELFVLPQRHPVVYNPKTQSCITLTQNPYSNNNEPLYAVAGFISPAYTQTLTAAYKEQDNATQLPLFSYTALGFSNEQFYAATTRVDPSRRQDLRLMDYDKMKKNVKIITKQFSKNRLIEHLSTCALTYGCPAAVNFFLQREECPLPTSPTCNANCIGCISLQTSGCCSMTQPRITFSPTPEEISETALFHINHVKKSVLSFGQGCEGEPLLAGDAIEEGIRQIRNKTSEGTINVNTNASLPSVIERLCNVGLNSIRVSLNSVDPAYYTKYYRPNNYSFDNVIESINIARKHNVFVSLNYLVLPGFTDRKEEVDFLLPFLKKMDINMIQWRNLNYDPLVYLNAMEISPQNECIGIQNLLTLVKSESPSIRFGYFNPYLNQ